jgi:hypothetical protein
MSKRWIWILVVVVLVLVLLFGGHALWHALLRMHGMH